MRAIIKLFDNKMQCQNFHHNESMANDHVVETILLHLFSGHCGIIVG